MTPESVTRNQVFVATTLLVTLCAAGTTIGSWGFATSEALLPALLFVGISALFAGAAGSWVFANSVSDFVLPTMIRDLSGMARAVARDEGIEVTSNDSEALLLRDTFVGLSERLQGAKNQLSHYQHLATVGEFAGALGCELRNPLLRITHQVEELALTEDTDRASQLTWQLQGEVDQMCRLVSDMVAFSRVRTPHREPVDLAVLAREIAFELPCVEEVKVVIDQSPDAPRAWVDSRQLRTAVMNVMKNGVEAMIEGGTMNVRIDTGREDQVVLEIRDRGQGIPADDRQRIFEPLFTTKQGATGLGMGIARNFVTNNGGEIHISSASGRGTTVRLELPATREYPGAARMVH